jgi:hypothetical protein
VYETRNTRAGCHNAPHREEKLHGPNRSSALLCNDEDRHHTIPTQSVENRHRFERFARDVSNLLWPFFPQRGRRRVVQRVAAAASIVKSLAEGGLIAPARAALLLPLPLRPTFQYFFVHEHPLDERLSFLFGPV